MKKNKFIFCSHCGELIDVWACQEQQLKEGKLTKFKWGIGANRKAIDEMWDKKIIV